MSAERQKPRFESVHVDESLRDSKSRLGETRPRGGMTLIELLVVIIILTTVVAAAIPLLSPSNDDRRLREATRGLNTYITGAQARAISIHRPFGIAIKRLSQDTKRPEDRGVSLEVFYVEQQAPYAGFDANSRACVAFDPNVSGQVIIRFVTRGTTTTGLPMGWAGDALPASMIRPRDVVQINGTQFELLAPNNTVNINVDSNGYYTPKNASLPPSILGRPLNDSGQQINTKYDDDGFELGAKAPPVRRPYWTGPAPYKILRQPTAASDEPYQLPEGTAIDLRASGVGQTNFFYVPGLHDDPTNQGIIIMFAPEGRVARVSFNQDPDNSTPFDQPIVDNVYLLVGKRENVAAPDVLTGDPTLDSSAVAAATTDEARAKLREHINWLSGNGRWIAIGSQTGRIATIENAAVDLASVFSLNPSLSQKSEELRTAQILAAREFTHEMGQLGGR